MFSHKYIKNIRIYIINIFYLIDNKCNKKSLNIIEAFFKVCF